MQFVVFIVHSSMDPPVHPLCVEPPKFQISQICTLSWNSQAKSKHPLPWVVVHGGGGVLQRLHRQTPIFVRCKTHEATCSFIKIHTR
jgi:hypothetical protein